MPYPPPELSPSPEIEQLRREEMEASQACSKADRVACAYALHGQKPPYGAIFYMSEEAIRALELLAPGRSK